mmetsp:Transcript_3172/g.7237  ORF Transcript_3172/g.7237 Transcript_3172/m.7237 type:complete len:98 (-) Transcript_3172:87-380(-)
MRRLLSFVQLFVVRVSSPSKPVSAATVVVVQEFPNPHPIKFSVSILKQGFCFGAVLGIETASDLVARGAIRFGGNDNNPIKGTAAVGAALTCGIIVC